MNKYVATVRVKGQWAKTGGCQIFCVNGVRLLLRHSFLKLNTKLI